MRGKEPYFTNLLKITTKKVVICLFLVATFSIIRSIYVLLGKSNTIDEARAKVAQLEREQVELIELQKKVNSPEFVEREARDRLGLAKEGEVVVVLPPEDVLRKLAPPEEKEPEYAQENPIWKQWVRMFFWSGV